MGKSNLLPLDAKAVVFQNLALNKAQCFLKSILPPAPHLRQCVSIKRQLDTIQRDSRN